MGLTDIAVTAASPIGEQNLLQEFATGGFTTIAYDAGDDWASPPEHYGATKVIARDLVLGSML